MIIHDIYDAPFIKEMREVTQNLWRNGWDERNGGNISYLLNEEEVSFYLDIHRVISEQELGFEIKELAGRIFMVSASGSYFKNISKKPAQNLAIVRITEDGQKYEILWGLETGGAPTSEFASHLKCHAARLRVDPNHRVILHCHAIAISAMTFVHSLNEKEFTRSLWKMITECIVVFSDGVSVLPWMVAGTVDIGVASAKKMEGSRIVVWPHHGIMGAGQTMDDAFGLVETAEKAADIYMRVSSVPGGIRQQITDNQLWDLADSFGVTPREGFLNKKS